MRSVNLKPCPFCGDKHRTLWHSFHAKRKYFMECNYCHACAKRAFTKWGARRNWNRMKNWRIVK